MTDLVPFTDTTRPTPLLSYHPWSNDMEVMNVAFDAQKEALELRHRHNLNQLMRTHKQRRMERMIARKNGPTIQQIERLKKEENNLREQALQLESELERTTAQLRDAKAKGDELLQFTVKLAHYGMRRQAIPPDAIKRCRQERSEVGKWSEPGSELSVTIWTDRVQVGELP